MDKNTVPENFTLSMVIVDAFPVIFFSLTAILIGIMLKNPVFIIGAVLAAFAGLCKVIWKLIVVKKKKNIWFLFVQMRIVMPVGFVLMILGVILSRRYIQLKEAVRWAIGFPLVIFFGIGVASLVAMMVLAFTLDSSKAKNNWIEQFVNGIGQFSIFLGMLMAAYFANYYHAEYSLEEYQNRYQNISNITDCGDYYYLTGIDNQSEEVVIFYPGAKVEPLSYIPSLASLNEGGIDCIIVKMPYHFAIFGQNKADGIKNEYLNKYSHWFIAGHSLGGAMAANYVSGHLEDFDGIILEASYSTKELKSEGFRALCIEGSNDGVINRNNADKYYTNLPNDKEKVVIDGGNHGQFGNYGYQKGDGEAAISKEEQWKIISDTISDFIKE